LANRYFGSVIEKTKKNHNQKMEANSTNTHTEEEKKDKKNLKMKSSKKQNTSKSDETTAQIAELEAKVAELTDKNLRLQAEFDNFRKRTLNEKMELIKNGGEDVLKSLLPMMDNFERAQASTSKAESVEAVKEGIDLIYNGFAEYLQKKGIKVMEAQGQVFDTDYHEALTKIPAPDESLKGKVVDVIEKGYTFNDKVIRFAKVVVGE
jgi:molecular chaperone GrpE